MKYKYTIRIELPCWKGYKYSVYYQKEYGDYSGGASGFKTKEDLLLFLREVIKEWEGYDYILGRKSDKVTPKNLHFESFTDEISKMELFGFKTLFEGM